MKINRIDIIVLSLLAVTGVYLFAQSPAPLVETNQAKGELIPVNTMFEMVAEENNNARKLWTKQIVVAGTKSGLKFGEEWHEKGVDQGPLPALFLREVATHLEKSPVPLSLFLGSDYPISSANKFIGKQAESFQKMRDTNGESQFFYSEDVERYTAMFADNVVVKGCATCHNEHPDSPKTDWVLNDIMGATTWAYPKGYVTRDESVLILSELRDAFGKAYTSFLDKLQTYKKPPTLGVKWPVDGYFIPTADVFFDRFENSAAVSTLRFLLKKQSTDMKEARDISSEGKAQKTINGKNLIEQKTPSTTSAL